MPTPLTPSVIERAGDRLAEGGWRYTPKQLYYAVCADLEPPPRRSTQSAATGEIGLGAILILVALILIRFPIPFVALLTLGLLLVVTGAVARARPVPQSPRSRMLAVSFEEFAHQLNSSKPRGVLTDDEMHTLAAAAGTHERIVVTDIAETAAMVNANRALFGIDGLAAIDVSAAPQLDSRTAVVALHDASPRGCALVADLSDRGVGPVDAGIRPQTVSTPNHQVLEGAFARLPRDLSAALTPDEVSWLASGRRVELATFTPAQVGALIREAIRT